MQAEGLPAIFIDTFAYYYERLAQGHTGLIPEADIVPVDSLPDAETLPDTLLAVGEAAKGRTAVIKLNGGLGTSMGLEKAKSLLPVKEDLTFLDIIARQALGAGMPLLLMNSFSTNKDSLAALAAYPDLDKGLPLSFVQHKELKITRSDLSPAEWPANPDLAWCPPGHGDIYAALVTSGALDALLGTGYEYAFVSNADNLGAVMDARILGYFAQNKFPFMMEAADRTEMDKKGGHLAQRPDGQLILRESAQTPAADTASFQDIARHKYFNTNNLWLNLRALQQAMTAQNDMLRLPMIRNGKTVDPRDAASMPVYQIETAMGSAIGVFAGASALRVPRTRFAPVKKTDDLLAVRSDAYTLTPDARIILNPARSLPPATVELDLDYYKFVTDLDGRFPFGPPSLVDCSRFSVQGDFKFGRNVVCRGEVTLVNESGSQAVIADGAVLEG
ncbi:MAG: UTP--glucose-1-phosphate uridylyltransferase [Chloroflexi bacterium]|nr:UTP--glucose-1-phosphate uridylyltransferase [Chloroflexota bacterium]